MSAEDEYTAMKPQSTEMAQAEPVLQGVGFNWGWKNFSFGIKDGEISAGYKNNTISVDTDTAISAATAAKDFIL